MSRFAYVFVVLLGAGVVSIISFLFPSQTKLILFVLRSTFDPFTIAGMALGLCVCAFGLFVIQKQRDVLEYIQRTANCMGEKFVFLNLPMWHLVMKLSTQESRLAATRPTNEQEQMTAVMTLTQNQEARLILEIVANSPSTPVEISRIAKQGIEEQHLLEVPEVRRMAGAR